MFLIIVLIDIVIYLKIIGRFGFVSSLIFPVFFICCIVFFDSFLFWSLLFVFRKRISIFGFGSFKSISLNFWHFIFTFTFTHIFPSLCTLSFRRKFDDFFKILIIIILDSFNNRMSFLVDFRYFLFRFLIILTLLLFYNFSIQ